MSIDPSPGGVTILKWLRDSGGAAIDHKDIVRNESGGVMPGHPRTMLRLVLHGMVEALDERLVLSQIGDVCLARFNPARLHRETKKPALDEEPPASRANDLRNARFQRNDHQSSGQCPTAGGNR